MDYLFIGDIHGRDSWRELKSKVFLFDKIIFVGDYVDSFDIKPFNISRNLSEIIKFKKDNMDKVILLIGNHDFAYVNEYSNISRFNHVFSLDYKRLFIDNWSLFDLAWGFKIRDRYALVTHAGLTKRFYDDFIVEQINDLDSNFNRLLESQYKDIELHEILNYFKNSISMWEIGPKRGGSSLSPSIIWVDKDELLSDNYPNIDQIVGHTPHHILTVNKTTNDDMIYFIDINQNECSYLNISF